MIDTVYRHCGQKETVIFCDRIMGLGFKEAARAGISFGKDDMLIPESKERIVDETRSLVKEYEEQYIDGLITQREKYNKVVDAWSQCTDRVANEMMARISATPKDPKTGRDLEINSIYMMAHSGARGSPAQMKQLAGMRGLMAKPSGEIIETPIISNFKEGLSVLEYFNSTHGARKGPRRYGAQDGQLRLSDAPPGRRRQRLRHHGRRLRHDRGHPRLGRRRRRGEVVDTLAERILGRTAAEDVIDRSTDEIMVAAGEMIDEVASEAIEAAGVPEVKIRSALTCDVRWGICAKCYGRDLARGTMVNMGEAVGVIAAQSIGEPGTQLTMRTFHIGGTAQVADQSFIEAAVEGTIKFVNPNVVKDSEKTQVVMGRNMQIVIVDEKGNERASHKMPYGARIRVNKDQAVKRGTRLAEWDPYTIPILTEIPGVVRFEDLLEGVSVKDVADEATGISNRVVVDWRASPRGSSLKPAVTLLNDSGNIGKLASGSEARYMLSVDAILSVDDGDKVKAGDVLARIPTEGAKTRDITGGLPRVAELFEARRPKDNAILAEIDGYVEFGKDYKNKRRIIVRPKDESLEPKEYLIPKGKHVALQEGDYIEKGEFIMDGNPRAA